MLYMCSATKEESLCVYSEASLNFVWAPPRNEDNFEKYPSYVQKVVEL